ncbi:MAG: xanthine dehydrogenase family protein molybdopterin-binding subunit, partial [Salinirussus sp.]
MSEPADEETDREQDDRRAPDGGVAGADAEAGTGTGTETDAEADPGVVGLETEQHPLAWDEPADNRKSADERETITTDREKYDARKIVTGEARYTADYRERIPELAEAKVVRSDVAHGRVIDIDTSAAEAMDGVHAVITPFDDAVPDTLYSPSGQSYPEPSPWDTRVLREHVRFVGDPVAAVAAEDAHTADRAARRIDVEYEEYEGVFDVWEATDPDAPRLFEDDEVENETPGADYARNLESHFEGELGDPGAAFAAAADEQILETEWETPYQSHCVPEPHTSIVYTDEDDRYNVVTATQVPYHTRRQLSHVFDVPIRDIRVIKPRVGAGFGSKQEMVIEPIALALHRKAGLPVKLECTRREEFHALRSRHPMQLRFRTAVDEEGTPVAMDLSVRENSGAYGTHGMTVASNVGTKALPLYPRIPNVRFEGDVVHTNLPMGAAMRGYGAPQGMFVVEGHVDELARQLGEDPIEFRKRHAVREGDLDRAAAIIKDDDRFARRIRSCGIRECIDRGAEAIGYGEIDQPEADHRHRGIGMALCAQGSGVAGKELGAAQIRMNEDGSFHLQVGGVDVGSGNDTMFTQVAAETLGCDPGDVVVTSSDTDLSPFDYGAYASSTTYISGRAVKKAAEDAKERILDWAARMLEEPVEALETGD